MRSFLLLTLPVVTALLLFGCDRAASGATTTPSRVEVPERVDEADFRTLRRVYLTLPTDHPSRPDLRDALIRYLDDEVTGLVEADDYEAVVARFAMMTDLLEPSDFEAGRLPRRLEPAARYLVDRGAPRGDEARVLAGLLVLRLLLEDEEFEQEYRELAQWGVDARATLPNVLERWSKLIDVWREHARLTPAPQVLHQLAQLHVERRDSVVEAFREGPHLMARMPVLPHQIMQIAPLDVAAVYLAHGDVASAITHVEAMGSPGESELRLLAVLEDARRGGDEGSDALIELAEAFREARPEVASGLCRAGLRHYRGDARFPGCLARVASEEGRYDDATGWYVRAIELAPDVRPLYDEALEQLYEFLEQGQYEADPGWARSIITEVEAILAERERRWPDSPPPVPAELMLLQFGLLEMHAGNAEQARARLRASLEERESPVALLQLGILQERTGSPDEAARLYRRALDLTPARAPEDSLERALLLEHLGDAFRHDGNARQAERMYRQSLELWEAAGAPGLDEGTAAQRALHMGVLLRRLGRVEESTAAFREAMVVASQWRRVYATILSHLVVSEPDLAFATEVFRRAQRHISLEPEWKVYFALWLVAIAERTDQEPPRPARTLLSELGRSPTWWGKLAGFGAGQIAAEELVSAADGTGEETEAHFYAGVRLLAGGDVGAARTAFERVMGTNMVGFWEFIMARELLDGALGADEASAAPAP